MEFVVPRARSLEDLLSQASSSDLDVLSDLITDGGKGRVALDSAIKALILSRKQQGSLQTIADVLASEIRAFAGNSVLNVFRSSAVSYEELATDVAKKLGGKPGPADDIYALEEIAITEAVKQHAPDHTEAGEATSTDLVARLVQGLTASSGTLIGIASAGGAAGVTGAVGSVGARFASAALPPVALVLGGATIFQAVGPAFRITVPAVLQVAKIRRIRFDADLAAYSKELQACL